MLVNAEKITAASTGFRALFAKSFAATMTIYGEWAQTIESENAVENLLVPGSSVAMREWKGERKSKGLSVYDVEVVIKDWEQTMSVPLNALKDDQTGLFDAAFTNMGVQAACQPDTLLLETLAGGFTKKSYDNVTFFAAGHVSGSNLQTGALSSTTFGEAVTKLLSQTDENGKALKLSKAPGAKMKLMVGPSNYGTAKSIVEVQNTTGGAGNPYYGMAEVVLNEDMVGDYAAYWFLGYAGGPVRPLAYVLREKASLVSSKPDSDDVIKRREVVHYGQARSAMALLFHQAIVGSTGA